MNFEEMQVLWDSQRERPLYAFDSDALARLIGRQSRKISCTVRFVERMMIAGTLALAGFLAFEPLVRGTDRHQLPGALLFLASSAYLATRALRRRRGEQRFESTLLGDLDRTIAQNRYHTELSRSFALWFLLPAAVVCVLRFAAREPRSYAVAAVALAGLALSYALARYELRCVHLPKQRELESLREKLAAPE